MKKIFILIISLIIYVSCYNPLDFNEFNKISLGERVNNFTGYTELTNFSVKLAWESKLFEDFIEYKLHRSKALPVDSTILDPKN